MELKTKRVTIARFAAIVLVSQGLFSSDNNSTVNLQEIMVTTASGFEQNIADAPATMTVISREEIVNKSYSDVTDVLKNVPGITIKGGGVEKSILMRGMSAEYTLFLIDGRPMQGSDTWSYNGSNAGGQVAMLPPLETIERIEIIRGPASGLYGSDAMGGVVNIITRKVSNIWSGSITQEYIMADSSNKVNNDAMNTSFALNGPLVNDVLGFQLTGSLNNIDESDYTGGGDAAASEPETKKKNFGTKFAWKVDDQNTLTAGNHYNEEEKRAHAGKSATSDSYSGLEKNNYFMTHEGNYGKLVVNSYVNYDDAKWDTNRTGVTGATPKGVEFDTLTLNTQATYMMDSHTLSGGATYKEEDLLNGATGSSNSLNSTGLVRMQRSQYSLFAEDEWRLAQDIALTLSGRYDDNEDFGSQVSPKAYLVYHMTDTISLKGGVITGYKAPSLTQAAPDYSGTSMGGVNIGNPDLTPETSLSYEVGLDYNNKDLGFKGSMVVYKTDFKDKITRTGYICAPNTVCVYNGNTYAPHIYGYKSYENVDEVELKGVEMTTDFNILSNLAYRQSYTYTDSEQKTGTSKGLPLNDLPVHSFNAGLDYDLNSKWRLWTQLNYVGESIGGTTATTANVKIPDYTFVDLGVVYKATKDLMLKLGVYNVANREVTNVDYGVVLDGRRYSAAFTYNF